MLQIKKDMTFVIAEKSYIIRSGLRKIIEDFRGGVHIWEVEKLSQLKKALKKHNPDVLLLNIKLITDPHEDIRQTLPVPDHTKLLAIVGSKRRNEHFAYFDDRICIDDEKFDIIKVLSKAEASLPKIKQQEETSELTSRECDVLKHVALGKTNKEIADDLFISAHTVITHRKNITKKIGIKTVSGLTVYAILNNIIAIEQLG